MLNRRFIREKVVQSLYSYYQGGEDNVGSTSKNLKFGIQKIHELYIFNFSLLLELVHFSAQRLEDGKNKHFPSEEDKNPNYKFVSNVVLQKLENNSVFQVKNAALKFNWKEHESFIRTLLQQITESSTYQSYMEGSTRSFEEDKEFILRIYKKKIATSKSFYQLCEEKSIFWASNFDSVCVWVMETLKNLQEEDDNFIPNSFIPLNEFGSNDEMDFANELLHKTIIHGEEYEKVIFDRLENWDAERVALIELIILKTAVSELINFPSIPIKVTLNEYIEVSKKFCSGKSRIFVNGLLNKIMQDLKEKKLIKKNARGLI